MTFYIAVFIFTLSDSTVQIRSYPPWQTIFGAIRQTSVVPRDGVKLCMDGWLEPELNCTVMYCISRDDDRGHFNCTSYGRKVCLDGWSKPSLNCLIPNCKPRDDFLGHYWCNEQGEKVCGWIFCDFLMDIVV